MMCWVLICKGNFNESDNVLIPLEPGPDLSLHLSHAIFHLFEDEALGGRSRSSDNGDNTELVH